MDKFVNPDNVVAQLGIQPGWVVADLGCGSGFYTLPAAKLTGPIGKVHAVDILDSKLAVTLSSARQQGLKNIFVYKADLDNPLIQIDEATCDLVIVASVIHQVYSKESLIKNIYRILKTGGKLLVVDWKKEASVFGPAMDSRISKEDVEKLMTHASLRKEKEVDADNFHYGIVFTK